MLVIIAPVMPDKLPMELIIARPAAAAAPDSRRPAKVQKIGMMLMIPEAAIEMSRTGTEDWCVNVALRINAMPASSAGMAACSRRSPVRFECMAFATITMLAATYGTAASHPIWKASLSTAALMMDGSQNDKP